MTAPDGVRAAVAGLAEVEEATHFGLPSFKVDGKGFLGVERGGATAIAAVAHADAERLASTDPSFEVVWRKHGNRQIYVGLRVPVEALTPELAKAAWRNKAPKRLLTSDG